MSPTATTSTAQISPFDPPFVQVEGVFNFRSVGGYISSITGPSGEKLRVKPNLLFRCGEISSITAAGAETLTSLNVNTIFDLRAKNEAEKFQTKSPNLANMKIVSAPVDQHIDFGPEVMAAILKKFEVDELNAFMGTYSDFLSNFGPALEAAIRHILDNPDHPQVTHCSVGKDRTGLLVAIVLLLLGVSETQIGEEYALTEIGLKPAYEKLTARLFKLEAFRNNPIGAHNLGSAKMETMLAAIKMMNEKYGSAEQYTLQVTNLSKEDIEALRKIALIPVAA